VAEEVSAEAKYDPTDDDSHDYGTDLLVTIRRLYISARDGKDPGEQLVSLNRMKDGIEQSEDPRLQQTYAFLMKNLASGAVTDPKKIMQIADKAHQLFHPSLEPIAQATREAVDNEEYSVDGGMNNELLQDGMLGSIVGGIGGAALTKSPGGAMAGAKLGSAVQDAFGEEAVIPDPKYAHEPPAQESDPSKYAHEPPPQESDPIPDDQDMDPIPDDQGDDQDIIARLQQLAGMAEEVAVTTGNPPLEETVSLQGQYGHSGKLQKFDEAEQDVLHRLRELSGMIRS
jgi:hypothetical protein